MNLVKNIFSGAAAAIKIVAAGVKKVWKSKLGKALIVAGALYGGGVELRWLSGPSALAGGAPLLTSAGSAAVAASPILANAISGASMGAIAGAATGEDVNILKGAALGGAAGAAYGAITAPGVGGPAPTPSAAPGAPVPTTGVPSSGVPTQPPGLLTGAPATPPPVGAPAIGSPAVESASWASENPLLAAGLLQTGGQMIAGYAAGKSTEAQIAEQRRLENERFQRGQLSGTPEIGIAVRPSPLLAPYIPGVR